MDQQAASSSSYAVPLSPAIDRYNPIIKDSRRNIAKPISPITITKSQEGNNDWLNKRRNKKTLQKHEPPRDSSSDAYNVVKLDDEKIRKISEAEETDVVDDVEIFKRPSYDDDDDDLLSNDNRLVLEKSHGGYTHNSQDQVVVLSVSLHCRGCERKMRKHISKMEGVTSFNIDFVAKKVTVTGNVTPLSVLSSISKVKNAQLWSPLNLV